jgi:hypothetical protein
MIRRREREMEMERARERARERGAPALYSIVQASSRYLLKYPLCSLFAPVIRAAH